MALSRAGQRQGATDLGPSSKSSTVADARTLAWRQSAGCTRTRPDAAAFAVDKNDPDGPGRLFVEVRLFDGTDADFSSRLAANSEPGKLPDSIEGAQRYHRVAAHRARRR